MHMCVPAVFTKVYKIVNWAYRIKVSVCRLELRDIPLRSVNHAPNLHMTRPVKITPVQKAGPPSKS